MTAEDEREVELRQMQKLKELRIQVQAAVARWWWLGLIVALSGCGILAALSHWNMSRNMLRCDSLTNLAFYPKRSGSIRELDDAQVVRILTRRSMFSKVADALGLAPDAVNRLSVAFEVSQDRKNRNFFAVKAYAPTEEEAILRANAFADVAIAEYRAFRLEDLKGWRESTDRRKSEIANEERRIETEENALNSELGIVRPFEEVSRLTRQISETQQKLGEIDLKIGELEALEASLKRQLNGVDTRILDESATVKKYADTIAEDDEQIEKLRRIYTDENPRLKYYLDERRETRAKFDALLVKYGVEKGRTVDLKRLEILSTEAQAVQRELAHQKTLKLAAEKGVENGTARIEALSKVLPRYEGLKKRRESLQPAREAIEATDASVRYLEASVNNEFYQIETATTATSKKTFSKKRLSIIASGGMALGALTLLSVVMLELLFGRVRKRSELASVVDATSLGVIGPGQDSPEEVFLRFREAIADRKAVFLLPLFGARVDASFLDALSFQCSLAGMKTLFVKVCAAGDCPDDPKATFYSAISYSGDHGVMPVVNPRRLSVGELALLEADLKILEADFDLVVVTLSAKGGHHSTACAQLQRLCATTLALVGIGRTPRRFVRRLVESGASAHLPVFLLGMVRSLALALLLPVLANGCYPTRMTGNYEQYPDLVEIGDGLVDEVRLDETERKAQTDFLRKLDEEPPEEFRINAGDRLKVVVYDHTDISGETTVTPDGYIGIVFLGQVKIAGLTLGEAAKTIETGLAKYIKKPAVGLTPIEIKSQTISLYGGVAQPGIYTISSDMRLADLYAKAGGSGVRKIDGQDLEIADLSNSFLFRQGYEGALPVDFTRAINGGDPLHNVRLKRNDRIFIGARTESFVTVVGHVRTPHTKLWNPNLSLLEVLTAAGWMEETYWSNVVIIRGGLADPHIYRVNVDDILAGKRANVRLAAGDIVYAPHDNISEYNVFVRKLLPTGQLFNLLVSPVSTWSTLRNYGN